MSKPEIQDYKGEPILNLTPGERYPVSFGVKKAKKILDNLEYIKNFVASNGETFEAGVQVEDTRDLDFDNLFPKHND